MLNDIDYLRNYNGLLFDGARLTQIRLGVEHKLNVTQYSTFTFSQFQMYEIRQLLEFQNIYKVEQTTINFFIQTLKTGKIKSDEELHLNRINLEREILGLTGFPNSNITFDLKKLIYSNEYDVIINKLKKDIPNINKYNIHQINILALARLNSLDISHMLNHRYNSKQMEEIYLGLLSGVNVKIYNDIQFTYKQMMLIRSGLNQGLNVKLYAKPIFNFEEMLQIKEGLELNLDVTKYSNSCYNSYQMEEIRLSLMENNKAIKKILNYILNYRQMQLIRLNIPIQEDLNNIETLKYNPTKDNYNCFRQDLTNTKIQKIKEFNEYYYRENENYFNVISKDYLENSMFYYDYCSYYFQDIDFNIIRKQLIITESIDDMLKQIQSETFKQLKCFNNVSNSKDDII